METPEHKIDFVKKYFTNKTLKYSGEIFLHLNSIGISGLVTFNDFTFQVQRVQHMVKKTENVVYNDFFWFDVHILDGTFETMFKQSRSILDSKVAYHRKIFINQAVEHVIKDKIMKPYFSFHEFYVSIRILNV